MDQNKQSGININKFISDSGMCSRREAEKFIVDGRVTINNKVAKLGNRVNEGDVVKVDGEKIKSAQNDIYIAFNKPVGIICTTELQVKNNIIRYINHPKRMFPIGRLDKESEGLIFLTNDGNIVNKILRAGNNHEKEYIVTVDKPLNQNFADKMSNGIPILGTITKKCTVEIISNYVFKIILTQGLNRQIRRMTSYLGYEVKKLKRVRIMNISLKNLAVGEWRDFSPKELDDILKLVAHSSKTESTFNPNDYED
jgi:23S rRNA pseudouridine2604 synthase